MDLLLCVCVCVCVLVLLSQVSCNTFYPEPHLHISVLNDGHLEVLVTSEGGYPSPSLQWLMGNETDITNNTHTQLMQDQHTHLYSVNSEFEISVPTRVQMGVYGESVLLSCTFPVSGSWESDSSVITWQRDLEVVHSFFHSRDQPEYQSARYAGRTSLFHQEMKNGNASLRLDRTTLEDAGEYTCSISTKLGSQRKSFSLKVAAFYPEPHLHISVLNDGHLEVLVTSEGGYPSPSLQWLMGNETDITNNTHTQLMQDQHTHLYSVNSKLNLSGSVNSSITFIMKNPDLGQEMRRNIDFFSENRGHDVYKQKITTLFFLGLGTGMVFIVLIILFFRWKRTFNDRFPKNGDVSDAQSADF